MDRVLGIDIGGTSIKVGLFSTEGTLDAVTKIPTGEIVSEAAFAVVTNGLKALLRENGGEPDDVIAIGLDVPGPVDDDGEVGMLANIELDPDGLKAAILREFPRANLAFVNDANAAALGELWQGTACGCGRKGCLEQYASAKGIVNGYKAACEELGVTPVQLDGPTDTLSIFNAHRAGDKAAKVAIDKMCDYLGYAMAQISAVVDPQVYLIGGGVGGGFKLYSEDLRTAYRKYCLAPSASTRILPASLGNDAAMYGCAFQALSEH